MSKAPFLFVSASSKAAFSALPSWSMNSSGHNPSKQPSTMPAIWARRCALRAPVDRSWALVSPATGRPSLSTSTSMRSDEMIPTTSLKVLPSPAAAMVERLSTTPIDASIWSPARIMMKLSTNPNATNGRLVLKASSAYCLFVIPAAEAEAAAPTAKVKVPSTSLTPKTAACCSRLRVPAPRRPREYRPMNSLFESTESELVLSFSNPSTASYSAREMVPLPSTSV
mmetsp:Transcript_13133/g.24329  ORF Transcript_13133/g.24329 Transcript_13133/m.24329 type:complete len:226 (-) Transcript_13133:156-833(-)